MRGQINLWMRESSGAAGGRGPGAALLMTVREEGGSIGTAAAGPPASPFVDRLYHELLARGIAHMFPGSRLETFGPAPTVAALLARGASAEDGLDFDWLGARYRLSGDGHPLSAEREKLLDSIGHVLAARYRLLFNEPAAAQRLHLFSGLAENRYVSAFLDPALFIDIETLPSASDRVSDAIEVLQVSALTTYENRRIATGVLLFGAAADTCHAPPPRPPGAIPYAPEITSSRSFHRLCDGLQTLALVDGEGLLVELVDVEDWIEPNADRSLPVPSPARYRAHSRATLCGGHVCLVLTPNGEIKIFAGGAQVFNFLEGRWHLTEAREKYETWRRAIGDAAVAERLFTAALDLAEGRRGALFVVLDDAAAAEQLVPRADLLTASDRNAMAEDSRRRFHYLLGNRRLLDVAPAVLESVARIDGAIVLDAAGSLLAFGTILRHPETAERGPVVAEGGRTTAALAASYFGNVLMVSEDGLVSFFSAGQCVWQL